MLSDFYKSKEWTDFRALLMLQRVNERGEIICAYCSRPIVKRYDCIGHHLVELTETNYRDVNIALNPKNVALVHHRCHNEIHEKTGYKTKKVFVVWGAPLSGKSTYVSGVAKYGDLIVDIDNLWQAVSGRPRYEKPNRIKQNVFALHNQLLTQVAQRTGFWHCAYIIGGYALPSEREQLARRLGAECIYIDSTKEECMARLAMCNDGRKKAEWEKYISDWWETHERFSPGYPPGPAQNSAAGGL